MDSRRTDVSDPYGGMESVSDRNEIAAVAESPKALSSVIAAFQAGTARRKNTASSDGLASDRERERRKERDRRDRAKAKSRSTRPKVTGDIDGTLKSTEFGVIHESYYIGGGKPSWVK